MFDVTRYGLSDLRRVVFTEIGPPIAVVGTGVTVGAGVDVGVKVGVGPGTIVGTVVRMTT